MGKAEQVKKKRNRNRDPSRINRLENRHAQGCIANAQGRRKGSSDCWTEAVELIRKLRDMGGRSDGKQDHTFRHSSRMIRFANR